MTPHRPTCPPCTGLCEQGRYCATQTLHDSGYGPIAEHGDQPQSDYKTWVVIGALMLPWVVLALWVLGVLS